MKMLKDRYAQTTARVVSVASCLWLPFLINGLFSLRKLRSVIYDESVDSSCFVLWELISTGQIKSRCWRTRVLKLLVELWALHLACGYPYINIIYTLTIYRNICKIYIWKRSMKSFSFETLNFFLREFWSFGLLHFGSCQNCMSPANLVAEIH